MSDVWISRPRWTCKYCNITINDDAPSRRQHENGFRHKNNVERAVRDATKSKHRNEVEQARAKREMQRIEKLAMASHAKDQQHSSSSSAPSSGPVEGTAGASSKAQAVPAWRPRDRAAHSDSPLARQLAAEEEARRAGETGEGAVEQAAIEANIGQWETVVPAVAPAADQPIEQKPRPAYRIREKQGNFDRADEEDDNDEAMQIRTKKRIRPESDADKQRSMLPSWTPMRIDVGVGVKSEGPQAVPIQRLPRQDVKLEDDDAGKGKKGTVKTEEEDNSATPHRGEESAAPTNSTTGSMFKKRKAGAGAGAKKVRAVI